jgi:hypothetical protein
MLHKSLQHIASAEGIVLDLWDRKQSVFRMGDRRRRRAKDVESDAESENSRDNQNSGSESGSDDGYARPPNYEDVVELESDTREQVLGNPVSLPGRKPRNEIPAKKDASFVPRSERFFLHDNRDDDNGGGKRGFGNTRGYVISSICTLVTHCNTLFCPKLPQTDHREAGVERRTTNLTGNTTSMKS